MKTKSKNSVEFNFHITTELQSQLAFLQDAGLSPSAVARLAIRKCSHLVLDAEADASLPKRVLLYLSPDEAILLDELAAHDGNRSRARTLRRLLTTYLRMYSSSIAELF